MMLVAKGDKGEERAEERGRGDRREEESEG